MGHKGSGARLAALFDDVSGAAALEAALVMPMLMVTMAGLVDGSRALVQSMQVRAAAHAGAEWAQENGFDAGGVSAAVAGATSLAASASPAPALFYGCASPHGVEAANKDNKCGHDPAGQYVRVTATAPFASWAPWPDLTWPANFSATAVVRID
jgi:hypothetical protein